MSETIQINMKLNKAFENYVLTATNKHMNYMICHILQVLNISINLRHYLNKLLN